jgi:LysM repeat protein
MRIRRRGRHTAPSQVEKVAEKAGKAAPAMAIAGALVAAPQAQHAFTTAAKPGTVAAADTRGAAQQQAATATLDSASAHTVLVSGTSTARHTAATGPASNTHYKVKSGDTLSGIAQQYYHKAADWQWLYHENDKTISDPNLIYPGQTLFVPSDPPANFTLSGYVPKHAKAPKHAKPAAPAVTTSTSHDSDSSGSGRHSSGGTVTVQAAAQGSHTSTHGGSGGLSGTLSCSGLEQLWDAAGGNPSHAFMAAEIAMAESGGNQYAHSPTDDFGYWQINASNGALATYNALGNAKSAIILSNNGTNWSPWTTYTAGLYVGRC